MWRQLSRRSTEGRRKNERRERRFESSADGAHSVLPKAHGNRILRAFGYGAAAVAVSFAMDAIFSSDEDSRFSVAYWQRTFNFKANITLETAYCDSSEVPAATTSNHADSLLPLEFVEKMEGLLGKRFAQSHSDRDLHSRDFSYHTPAIPAAVIYADTPEEVSEAIKLCNEYKIPVIPYGSGTSLEGHIIPNNSATVTFNMRHLSALHQVNVEDMTAKVGPGLSYSELNFKLAPFGLFFPLDPGPGATVGGMINTSCSGPNAVRYGTAKDQIISLTVVTAEGKIVRTKSSAKKSSAGYDLTHLFIGSEGTLGIVVEALIKLQKVPEARTVATCTFDAVDLAAKSVIEMMQNNIRIGKVEMLDAMALKSVNLYSGTTYTEKPTLLFEFTGTQQEVDQQIRLCKEISSKFNGGEFKFSTSDEEREELWRARKEALWAAPILQEGSSVLITDVCVPVSRLADCLNETEKDIEDTGIFAPMVSHAGDGNFHLFVLFDPNNKVQMQKALDLNDRLVMRAIGMDGTCTGEHGVGVGKMKYLPIEHGEDAVDLMRRIKHSLDPNNILNPGKIFTQHASETPHGHAPTILTNEQVKAVQGEH